MNGHGHGLNIELKVGYSRHVLNNELRVAFHVIGSLTDRLCFLAIVFVKSEINIVVSSL